MSNIFENPRPPKQGGKQPGEGNEGSSREGKEEAALLRQDQREEEARGRDNEAIKPQEKTGELLEKDLDNARNNYIAAHKAYQERFVRTSGVGRIGKVVRGAEEIISRDSKKRREMIEGILDKARKNIFAGDIEKLQSDIETERSEAEQRKNNFIKHFTDKGISEEEAEALYNAQVRKLEYDGARERLREHLKNEKVDEAEIFNKVFIEEYEKLQQAQVESWPPKEKSTFQKAVDWWKGQSPVTRLIISTLLISGGVFVTGGFNVPVTAMFAGQRFIRGAGAVIAGQMAGKGVDWIFGKVIAARHEASLSKLREGCSAKSVEEISKELEEIFEEKAKRERSKTLIKAAAMVAVGVGTATGLKMLENYWSGAPTPETAQTAGQEQATTGEKPREVVGQEQPRTPLTPSDPIERGLKSNFSLELGKGGVPPYLERVFHAMAVNHMKDIFGSDNIFGAEEGAKSLNMAANLVRLAEGRGVAGIDPDDIKGIFAFNPATNVLEIKDYVKFNNLLDSLKQHSDNLWERGILQGKGAAASYLDNIRKETWFKSIIKAEGLEKGTGGVDTGIQGHDAIDSRQIQDFEKGVNLTDKGAEQLVASDVQSETSAPSSGRESVSVSKETGQTPPPEGVVGGKDTIAGFDSATKLVLDSLDRLIGSYTMNSEEKIFKVVEQINSGYITVEDFARYYAEKLSGGSIFPQQIENYLRNNFDLLIKGGDVEKTIALSALKPYFERSL